MIRVLMIFNLCCFSLSMLCAASSGQVEVPSGFESLRLRPLQEQKTSSYQNESYRSQKSFEIKPSSSQLFSSSAVSSSSYPTRSFLGIKNPWFGKKVFFDNSETPWQRVKTSLGKKVFLTRAYPCTSNLQAIPSRTLATSSYPAKRFYPDANAQGGLDDDIQRALQKAKSPEEVRTILEQK